MMRKKNDVKHSNNNEIRRKNSFRPDEMVAGLCIIAIDYVVEWDWMFSDVNRAKYDRNSNEISILEPRILFRFHSDKIAMVPFRWALSNDHSGFKKRKLFRIISHCEITRIPRSMPTVESLNFIWWESEKLTFFIWEWFDFERATSNHKPFDWSVSTY